MGQLPRITCPYWMLSLDLLFWLFVCPGLLQAQTELNDPKEIIRRSVEASQHDWKQLSEYDYFVLEHEDNGAKTYLSLMLLGSRYNRLVAIDEKPLSPAAAAAESERLERETSLRRQESPQERRLRIAKYRKEIERNEFFLNQLGNAFDFALSGTDNVGGHEVYVLTATPHRGYHPPNTQAKALTGMQGTLWVDRKTLHWVKVRAEVVRPVAIEGFMARVERGTRFELDQAPTVDGLWLPSRFLMETHSKLLFFFSHHDRENESYFDYHKSEKSPSEPLRDPRLLWQGRTCYIRASCNKTKHVRHC